MARQVPTSNDIAEMLDIALSPDGSGPKPAGIQAAVTRNVLAAWLRSYGEDRVAVQVPKLSDSIMQKIFQRGGVLYLERNAYMRALCLAAVEVIEGQVRPLALKRRKNAT
jgi:hypothetical protein